MPATTKQWEIAERGFADGWYRIGTGEGSNPRSALESWVERKRTVRPGFYGVRSPGEGEAAWQPFHLDASGALHDRANQTTDAHRADEPSVRPKTAKEILPPFPMARGILILAAGGVGIANLLKRRHRLTQESERGA
jgi:hypothetical protein